MNILINFIKQYFSFLKRVFKRKYSITYVEDPVEKLKNRTLYIIGSHEEPWQAEFLCPCGCRDKIVLPVNKTIKPNWTLSINDEIPTLSPSIWRSKGCLSHFWLKKGNIVWC